jgi:hypothetical protein
MFTTNQNWAIVDGNAAIELEVAISAIRAKTMATITTMPLGSAATGKKERRREVKVGPTSV